jgi:acyl-CoA synthetase (AMP-forming)/AMP-acid ligase II
VIFKQKLICPQGGENIFPLEIEERLAQHPSVIQSSVVGVPDEKYGEVVGAFLEGRTQQRPSRAELREYVRQTLGWHKAPVHIFWLMEGESFPKTGSGKVQKHILKVKAQALLRNLGKEFKSKL